MLGQELSTVILGLASAATMGAADFTGGLATRRTSPGVVIAVSHAFGLLLLAALAVGSGAPAPSVADLGWAAGAGLCMLAGLAALYRAMALGRIGRVAPISGVLAAALPVMLTIFTHGLPGPLRLSGFALGLAGISLLSRSRDQEVGWHGVGLALWAGLSFGTFFVLLGQVGSHDVLWSLVTTRATSCLLAGTLVLLRQGAAALIPARGVLQVLLLVGVLDVAGTGFFALAAQSGRLDIAAVLCSLYPGSTVILARVILRERLDRTQLAGIVAALAAIVLITLG